METLTKKQEQAINRMIANAIRPLQLRIDRLTKDLRRVKSDSNNLKSSITRLGHKL